MGQRQQVTEAERAARRQADRDRLEEAARALLSSDGWQRWVRVRATNGLARYCLVISGPRVRDTEQSALKCRRHVVDTRARGRSGHAKAKRNLRLICRDWPSGADGSAG